MRVRNRSNHTNEMIINTISLISLLPMNSYVRMRIINFRQKGVIEIEWTNRTNEKQRRNQSVAHVKQISIYSCSLDCNENETIWLCVVCTVMYNENNENKRRRKMTKLFTWCIVYSLECNRRHVWVWKEREREIEERKGENSFAISLPV